LLALPNRERGRHGKALGQPVSKRMMINRLPVCTDGINTVKRRRPVPGTLSQVSLPGSVETGNLNKSFAVYRVSKYRKA
jgi:hypothetical protein